MGTERELLCVWPVPQHALFRRRPWEIFPWSAWTGRGTHRTMASLPVKTSTFSCISSFKLRVKPSSPGPVLSKHRHTPPGTMNPYCYVIWGADIALQNKKECTLWPWPHAQQFPLSSHSVPTQLPLSSLTVPTGNSWVARIQEFKPT